MPMTGIYLRAYARQPARGPSKGECGCSCGPPSNTLATHRQNPAKPLAPGAAYAPGGRKRVGDTA